MKTILSEFLNAGLLPIGEDDHKLSLLEDAASELGVLISTKPLEAVRFVLVAFDSQCLIDDPVIEATQEIVRRHWATIANKLGPEPIQAYRAVILRALEIAATDNPRLQLAIQLIASNPAGLRLQQTEHAVIEKWLGAFDSSITDEICETWITPVGVVIPTLSSRPRKGAVGRDDLAAKLQKATGPPETADALASFFQTNAKAVVDDLHRAVKDAVDGLTAGIGRLAIRDAKSELLWIRASMYSPSAKRSLHTMNSGELAFYCAIDVNRAVDPLSPPSVEFFLQELVKMTVDESNKLVDVIPKAKPLLEEVEEKDIWFRCDLPARGRRTWLDLALRPGNSVDFEKEAGVSADYSCSASELSVAFFREIQVRRLLQP